MTTTISRALTPISRALVTSAALFLPLGASAQSMLATRSAPLAPTAAAPVAGIALELYRTRWTVTATVGGRARRYLFDTGGGLSFVSAATAAEAGCTPWGRITGFNMFGRRGDSPRCDGIAFELGGHRFTPPVTPLIDMGKLNPRDSAIDGIVALDMFADRAVTLDLAGGHIVVESAESLAERVRGMTPLPIRINREASGFALAVLAGVPSPRGTLWLELDSGNGGTILVSKPVASLLGLDPDATGKQNADFPVVGALRVRSADAYTPDMIMDGNLGMPFLRDCLVTLDLKAGRAWIAAASTAPNDRATDSR